jgi:hypothetical protein
MPRKFLGAALLCLLLTSINATSAESKVVGLSDTTVLVIRHAEKPASGNGLSPEGQARANAYVKYFEPFSENNESFNVDALYATSDTTKSARDSLTLDPLQKATGLKIDTRFGNYDVEFLAQALRTESHGKHVLVVWHHGRIPHLITALGGNAKTLLPNGKWPDNVYDWVIEFKYDKNGKLITAERIQEHIQ